VNRLVITEDQAAQLSSLFDGTAQLERVVLLVGSVVQHASDGGTSERYVVQKIVVPDEAAYALRTSTEARLTSEYLGPQIRAARGPASFVGFMHNHPGVQHPSFSLADASGEAVLLPFLTRHFGGKNHVTVVAGSESWTARKIGGNGAVDVSSVGRMLTRLSHTDVSQFSTTVDRQVQLFGTAGQALLGKCHIAIVGAGGTGSVVAQQLVHLGVGKIRLIDFDTIEQTNLNRVVGARSCDVGRMKVDVLAQYLTSVGTESTVVPVSGDVTSSAVAESLLDCDLIFSCTDSHGSRAVLNQLAYQYYLPCIDVGVSISAKHGSNLRVTGRTQLLAPGLGCLTCGRFLDPDEVRRDLMTPAQRQADPYIVGSVVPQPAVISINSAVASLAVTMALSVITGVPTAARMHIYDGVAGTVRSAVTPPDPRCIVCSHSGALGKGASWELMGRRDP
jgi:molybdopterin/thiamine biosynthesis adenylyltransferase